MNKNDTEDRDSRTTSSFHKTSLSSLISTPKPNRVTVAPAKVVRQNNVISDNIAKLLLSLIYDWNNDEKSAMKNALSKPTVPLHFGFISSNGIMSFYMPSNDAKMPEIDNKLFKNISNNILTTTHSIAIIALSNAMAFNSSNEQKIKHLPADMCPPKIQLLIEKWQDSCIEIRSASQFLLLQELNRAGANERKKLITAWAPYLPVLLDSSLSILGKTTPLSNNISFSATALNFSQDKHVVPQQPSTISLPPTRPLPPSHGRDSSLKLANEQQQKLPNAINNPSEDQFSFLHPIHGGINQIQRNQGIAIVLLGVIGTEFSNEFDKRNTVVRATALSLFELLIAPESVLLLLNSTVKQSAIELIGSGFSLWQPHLDLSKVLVALLELSASEENIEIALTAKNSLSLIASTSPKAVITALATEVTRYNSIHQTTQITIISPLKSSKTDILRILEQLIENYYSDVVELIIPVCDILIHCLDLQLLKHQNFYDLFPPISKLHMIAYCPATKKLAIGGNNGVIVIHELKNIKSQTVQAHNSLITSIAFSSDGKFLAVYASKESKITLWQTHQTFLGMGQSQMKLIKAMTAPTELDASHHARLVWIGAKMLKLLLSNGTESIIQI
uniref:Uncharacterized protein n=1 Tax=Panagrolaimus sp. ES5 TaxID=591445 RepID=A0AC34FD95_9BILA